MGANIKNIISKRNIATVSTVGLALISLMIIIRTYAYSANDFVTTWQTTMAGETITIPTTGGGYNYNVDCDDDSIDDFTAQTGDVICTYPSAGTYTVVISDNSGTGTGFPRIYFNNTGDKDKILTVEQWGTGSWTSMASAFSGASNLSLSATDTPDLSSVNDMSAMFNGATAFSQSIGSWDMSNISNASNMLDNSALSAINYDATLIGWDSQALQSGVTLGAVGLSYCSAESQRLNMITSDSWVINGDSLDCPAPGGVDNDLLLWLGADAGTSTTTDGTTLTSWSDQSSAGHSAVIQLSDPSFENDAASLINFNPIVHFDGDDGMEIVSGILGTNLVSHINVFTVTRNNIGDHDHTLFVERTDIGRLSAHTPWSDGNIYWDAGSVDLSNRLNVLDSQAAGEIHLYEFGANDNGASDNQFIIQDGIQIATDTSFTGFSGIDTPFVIADGAFNGDIAEMIVYTSPSELTTQERNNIQSYLAIKYGNTLAPGTAQNYTASDNAVVWGDAAYNSDIVGIGRDDATTLDQRVSHSISSDAILTVALDADFIAPNQDAGRTTDFDNDISYFVAGNNNTATTTQNTELDTALYNSRLTREWKVDRTNFTQDVHLKFDGLSSDSIPYLIKNATDDFSSGSTEIGRLDINGEITVSAADLADGEYFTLAMVQVAPGGVASNLGLWLKANKGTSTTVDSAEVNRWNDQSGFNRDAVQTTSPQQALYRNYSAMNYNPALRFQEGNKDFYDLPSAVDVLPGNIFTVSRIIPGVANINDTDVNTLLSHPTLNYNLRINYDTVLGNTIGRMFESNPSPADVALGTNPFDERIAHIMGASTSTTQSQMTVDGDASSPPDTDLGVQTDLRFRRIGKMFNGSSSPSEAAFHGFISEIILYNQQKTANEELRVNSYLATKYGITLTEGVATDYLATDSTPYWTGDAAYQHGVSGMGRDDLTALDQRVSRSLNLDAILTMALDADFSSTNQDAARTTTFDNDKSYIMAGHDDGPTTTQNTEIDTTLYNARLTREWKIDRTNFTQDIHMRFGGLAQNIPTYLIKNTTDDFSSGSTEIGQLDTNGDITVSAADLADGEYFTLAMVQVAPGGVAPNLQLWLKADGDVYNTGTTQAIDNQTIDTWVDSASNFDALEDTSGIVGNNAKPTFQNDSANWLNFGPTIDFDGTQRFKLANTAAQYPLSMSVSVGNTTYSVLNNISTDGSVLSQEGLTNKAIPKVLAGGHVVTSLAGGGFQSMSGGGINAGNPVLNSHTRNGRDLNTFSFGAAVASLTLTDDPWIEIADNVYIGERVTCCSSPITAQLPELIAYNDSHTTIDRQKIQSYLATKYGMTITEGVATDYLATDGAPYWTGDVAYQHDVFGLGRDDLTALNQKVSKSVNSDAIITMALDDDFTSANQDAARTTTFAQDLSYFMVGNDDGAATWTTTGAPAHYQVLSKQWRADKTGTVGTINMQFDVANTEFDVPVLKHGTEYYIVTDTNVNNDLSDETPIALTNTSGDLWSSALDLSDGAVFSLATQDIPTSELSLSSADAEATGGNLPVILIRGIVNNSSTVTITDAGTGTATAGTDYAFTSPQVITIPAGTYDGTAATAIAIPTLSITNDSDIESNETIDLTLSLPTVDVILGDANTDTLTTTTHTYTITNDDFNNAPTDIQLDGANTDSVDENATNPTTVGALTTTDPNTSDTHTYTLGCTTPGADDALFQISGTNLQTNAIFDFEAPTDANTDGTYEVCIRTTDSGVGNLTYDELITITINDLNAAPTNIDIDSGNTDTQTENTATDTTIGTLTSTDDGEDNTETYTYSLGCSTAGVDDAHFNISGTDLRNTTVFDFESPADDGTDNTYDICVRVTETNGELSYDENLTITVTDTNAAPTNIDIDSGNTDTQTENTATDTTIGTLTSTDDGEDNTETYTYSLGCSTAGVDDAHFNISGTDLRNTTVFDFESPADDGTDNTYDICVRVTETNGELSYDENLTITVTDTNAAPTNIDIDSGNTDTQTENTATDTTIGTLTSTDDGEDNTETYTYSLGCSTAGVDDAHFNISGTDLRNTTVFDFESPADDGTDNTYDICVRVTETNGELSYDENLTITVTDTNAAPTNIDIDSGNTDTQTENTATDTTIGTLTSTDDGEDNTETYTYSLGCSTAGVDDAHFNISGTDLRNTTVFDFESPADDGTDNTYDICVRVTETNGELSYDENLTITVTDTNAAPTNIDIDSGNTDTQTENTATDTTIGTLTSTDDGEDNTETYTYSLGCSTAGVDDAHFNISGTDLRNTTVFDFESPADDGTDNTYDICVRVTETNGELSYDENLTITVTDTNAAPTNIDIDSGNTDTQTENTATDTTIGTLTSTDDGEDNTETYTYSLGCSTAGVDDAHFNISGTDLRNTTVFDFESPADDGTDNTYDICVRVTETNGELSYDENLTITVTDTNAAPTNIDIDSGNTDTQTENTATDTTIGTLTSTDDGEDNTETYTYSLGCSTAGVDDAHFNISGTDLRNTTVFDFESPADDGTDNTYDICVRVTETNGELSYDENLTITVTDTNAAPTNIDIDSGNTDTQTENTATDTTIGTLTSTDDGEDNTETYTYSLGCSTAGVDDAHFNISGTDLRNTTVFDFESPADDGTDNTYDICVRVTETNGELSYDENLTITVTDTNAAPTNIDIDSGNTDTQTENTATDTTIGTLTSTDDGEDNTETYTYSLGCSTAGVDDAHFNISGTDLRNTTVFDFESPADDGTDNTYDICVRVTETNGELSYDENLTITVTDTNAAPTNIDIDSGNTDTQTENTATDTTIGTLTSTDDGEDNTETYTYSLGCSTAGVDDAHFNISGTDLRNTTVFDFESPADDGTDNTYDICVRVTETNGELSYDENLTITVTDLAENQTPTDIQIDTANTDTVDENATNPTTVGALTTTDPNTSDTHTYTLGCTTPGADDALFQISGTNLQTNAIFDFEAPTDANTDGTYEVCIRTTDSGVGNLTYDELITITINDLNAAPTNIDIDSGNTDTQTENTATDTTIGTLTSTDDGEDNTETYTYSLGCSTAGVDDAHFNISGTELRNTTVFDFESPADDGTDNTYDICVRVTETNGELSYDENLTITVTDLAENQTPTDIQIDTANTDTVDENATNPTTVGALTTTDPNTSDTHTYTLGCTTPGADDALFQISGTNLQTNVIFDFEAPTDANTDGTYEVCIRTTDSGVGNLTYDELITITINDLNDLDTDNDGIPNTTDTDDDGDGVLDTIEDSSAPNGDGNGDGALDSLQSSVTSVPNPATGAHSTLVAAGDCSVIDGYSVETETDQALLDPDYDYPVGLNDFNLTCGSPGQSATVTIYYDQVYDTSAWTFRKFNENLVAYATVPDVSYQTATVNTTQVTTASYTATDGGDLDQDNTANGTITDPAGPGVLAKELQETGQGIWWQLVAGGLLTATAVVAGVSSRKQTNNL